MTAILLNNALDVVYSAFSEAFFQGVTRMFWRDNEMCDIVLTDADARDKVVRFFFNRALREVQSNAA